MAQEANSLSPASFTLADAVECFNQGDLQRAWSMFQELAVRTPDSPELLHAMSLVCARRNEWEEVIRLVERALVNRPNHPMLLSNLCIAQFRVGFQCVQQNRKTEASVLLQKVVRHDPAHVQAHRLLVDLFMTETTLHRANYHQRMLWHYSKHVPGSLPHLHTFFASREKALHCALHGNPLCKGRPTIDPLYYYTGDPIPNAPPSLIRVPPTHQAAVAFLLPHTLALPADIDFDPGIDAERRLAESMLDILDAVNQARQAEIHRLGPVCQTVRPVFHPGQLLRVYLPATRKFGLWPQVKDLAQGFRSVGGCEVLYLAEQSGQEVWSFHHWQQVHILFQPHIVIDLNGMFGYYHGLLLHPDVFRVAWFSDFMPYLVRGVPMPWRERDLIYSLEPGFDAMLYRCGAPQVQRQVFCYDDAVFRDWQRPRKRKVVFIGSGYSYIFNRFKERADECRKILSVMSEMLDAGERVTDAVLDRLTSGSVFIRGEVTLLLCRAVRIRSVHWLCELSDEIEVEFYGPDWELNDIIRPFYKGVIPHGPEVVELYNDVQYVLVNHPFDLHSTRMFETAACGAIPIVYDCRHQAATPHWDDHCLWYLSKEEMRACFTKVPTASPHAICAGKTYAEFARRILAEVESRLSSNR
ncbi:MAG: hypothetical protein HQL88_05280 [Magnetococcales bacterium]|nr:hypothetical protein [Magnetococcales bacterium]